MNDVISLEQAKREVLDSMGYATHLKMLDGGNLCLDCMDCESNVRSMEEAYKDDKEGEFTDDQWLISEVSGVLEYHSKDEVLVCDGCHEAIDSVYGIVGE